VRAVNRSITALRVCTRLACAHRRNPRGIGGSSRIISPRGGGELGVPNDDLSRSSCARLLRLASAPRRAEHTRAYLVRRPVEKLFDDVRPVAR
jgi:hypothetical protein